MAEVLMSFGILIALIGLFAVVRPKALLALVRRITVKTWLRVTGFVIRLLLGGLLILVAPSTAFPLVVRLIGALIIAAGVVVLLIGNEGVQRLVNRALRLSSPAVVAGGILGIVFGVLLIYLGYQPG